MTVGFAYELMHGLLMIYSVGWEMVLEITLLDMVMKMEWALLCLSEERCSMMMQYYSSMSIPPFAPFLLLASIVELSYFNLSYLTRSTHPLSSGAENLKWDIQQMLWNH